LIEAGRAFHETMVAKAMDQSDEAESKWQAFKDAWLQAAAGEAD
jgi:hypothetical protein